MIKKYLGSRWSPFVATFSVILFFYLKDALATTSVVATSITFGLPLAMAAMVGIMCERTGIVNIGIEGTLLVSSFIGFFVASVSGNLLVGLFAAVCMGAVSGLLLALLSVTWKMDQIIAGTIINILATGLTSFFYKQGHTLPSTFPEIDIPGLSAIPFFGPVLFMHGPLTFLGFFLILVLWVALYFTPWGLRSRSVGEHPGSADTAGVSVVRMRYLNVTIAGAFGGLTGAYLTLELVGSWDRGFSAGRGFTALALMIFGRWNPLGALAAALFFGVAQAITNQLMITEVVTIPQQFTNMLPYVLTILILAISAGKVRAPAAEGQPYEKESA
ncbi:MAG: ABC transporter permease [Actinomycetota bacterium]